MERVEAVFGGLFLVMSSICHHLSCLLDFFLEMDRSSEVEVLIIELQPASLPPEQEEETNLI